jgi:alpha-N-arabinofuranosidase
MNRIVINTDVDTGTISRHIYGHFSEHLGRCIYEGYWVGEDSAIPNTRGIRNDVVEALRRIRIPNLRWPGGCFADEYHWRDGIGPRESRPGMVNTHWGQVTENNHFGTHEFMDLCEQLGCEPYICGNVGSGSVQEMSQWIEYVTFPGRSPMADLRRANGREHPWKLTYWGVGNENWGCGGAMRPEHYADLYRRYAVYCRSYGQNKLFKVACGAPGPKYEWTDVLMREAASRMNGLALHYYCGSGAKSRSATEFDEEDWFEQLKRAIRMDELITRHATIMDVHDPEKKVAMFVDEWGAWHQVEPGTNPGFLYQQNTLRDALVAAITLDIFNKHCGRVRMANIAQTVNVLQAMILTDGGKMLLTPSYHVFDLYQVHHDAARLDMHARFEDYPFGEASIPAISASASRDAEGKVHLTLSNSDPNRGVEVSVDLRGGEFAVVTGRVLTGKSINAHNTFAAPETIQPVVFDGATLCRNVLTIAMPSKSVVGLEITSR